MGLIEKRLIKQGQEEWLPESIKDLREVTGGQQIYEMDWETFATDADALNNVNNQGLRRITAAFRIICADDLGKEAAATLSKIVVRNVPTVAEKGVTVKDGIATVLAAYGKGSDGYFTDNELIKRLEKLL
ncbi:MAG: hypothetical protein ABJE95_11805 [Byssovorax sp.]